MYLGETAVTGQLSSGRIVGECHYLVVLFSQLLVVVVSPSSKYCASHRCILIIGKGSPWVI